MRLKADKEDARPISGLRQILTVAYFCGSLLIGQAAFAQEPSAAPQTPLKPLQNSDYDNQARRFAEIMGSLQYLQKLCTVAGQPDLNGKMQQWIDAEADTLRKERITAAFNRGYRGLAAVYNQCNPQAKALEKQYRNEGATLIGEMTSRFGN